MADKQSAAAAAAAAAAADAHQYVGKSQSCMAANADATLALVEFCAGKGLLAAHICSSAMHRLPPLVRVNVAVPQSTV